MTAAPGRLRRPQDVALLLLLLLAVPALAPPRAAQAGPGTLPTGFVDDLVVGGLNLPVGLAEVPDPATVPQRRLVYIEQVTGRVALVVGSSISTVGMVGGLTTNDTERGLLGVTIDPGWPARPYLYVHATVNRGNGDKIAISRFTLSGDLAYSGPGQFTFDPATRYDLRDDLPDTYSNHNGGTVRFGPDGRLYVSLGDDYSYCPAQDLAVAVGKILRLDVSRLPATGTGPAPYAILTPPGNPYAASPDSVAHLVWTEGLRNPFRFWPDAATGTLVVGDVGEGAWEELDLVTAGGMDMGWPLYEGPDPLQGCAGNPPAPLTGPIADYTHLEGKSIIAGPRYRRPGGGGSGAFAYEYDGDCFYLDYYTGFLRRVKLTGGTWAPAAAPGQPNASDWGTGLGHVSDLVELSDGTLAYVRQYTSGASSGEIRRIAYTGSAGTPPAPPPALALATPRPNPSRGSVAIAWTQPAPGRVTLAVYTLDGRRVRTLRDGEVSSAGSQTVTWDGLDAAGRETRPGVYFVRLDSAGASSRARLTRLTRLR